MNSNPSPQFWKGKRVLLTGHTGFKGAWLTTWLLRLGAQVTGISLPPATRQDLYSLVGVGNEMDSRFLDIQDASTTACAIHAANPEIVFHLAAQPLVRAGYRNPSETFAINVQGTVNVLDALRVLDGPRVVVAVTTDKVYHNLEQQTPFRETDSLGGHDPYSASKAAAELVIDCYRQAFLKERGVAVASARAGNVIGGGDWAEDRLIPDAIRAWNSSVPLVIRRPYAVRPWQHVLEPLSGYLRLAESLWREPSLAGAFNFGPNSQDCATVKEVITLARRAYQKGEIVWDESSQGPHESGWLSLEISKAQELLQVSPRWNLEMAVLRTLDWYRQVEAARSARSMCERDIEVFTSSESPPGAAISSRNLMTKK